jgi:predicted phage-related endonuclease
MSLERIDRYIKEIRAIRDYDKVCQQLNNRRAELIDQQKINSVYQNTIESQSSAFKFLSDHLAKKQVEVDDFKQSLVAQIKHIQRDLDYLEKKERTMGFKTLGILVDDIPTSLMKAEQKAPRKSKGTDLFDLTEAEWKRLEKAGAENESSTRGT